MDHQDPTPPAPPTPPPSSGSSADWPAAPTPPFPARSAPPSPPVAPTPTPKPRKPRNFVFGPVLLLLVTVLLVMYFGPRIGREIAWEATDARIQRVRQELADADELRTLSESFRLVAEGMRNSVVHIKAYQTNGAAGTGTRYEVPQHVGNGSGWVYEYHAAGEEPRRFVITNYHVIKQASRIVVRFADGSETRATAIGADPKTDIAVLFAGNHLHAAPLALDDEGRIKVEQGDIVFAFGSPFRFEFSVSQGVISAKGRKGILREDGSYENFIQTDAAINPGNSGGPLTNVRGQVIGMNTAIATRDGGSDGLGFAIPIDMIKQVADQIIRDETVKRGYLGIFIATLDARQAATFGLEHPDGRGGVVVERPAPGGPADEANVKRGDIITDVDGTRVADADVLRAVIAGKAPDTTVRLRVFRDGGYREIDVTLAELPDRRVVMDLDTTEAPGRGLQGEPLLEFLGFETVEQVTRAEAIRRGLGNVQGVLVIAVRANSIVDTAEGGPLRDLVITRVADEPITTRAELIQALEQFGPGQIIRITVQRGSYVGYRYLDWPLN